MSKDKDLYKRLRRRGVRKGVAKKVATKVGNGSSPGSVRSAAKDLSTAADEIEARLGDDSAKRKLAAQKAARTRKRDSAKRSSRARQAAGAR